MFDLVLPLDQVAEGYRAMDERRAIKDSLIAATALTHDLTVVTRNRSDFEKAGVAVVDPFA